MQERTAHSIGRELHVEGKATSIEQGGDLACQRLAALF